MSVKQQIFFVIDSNGLDMVGTFTDPANLIATTGYNRPADYVFVAGKLISENGILIGIDEEKIVYKANRKVKELLDKRK